MINFDLAKHEMFKALLSDVRKIDIFYYFYDDETHLDVHRCYYDTDVDKDICATDGLQNYFDHPIEEVLDAFLYAVGYENGRYEVVMDWSNKELVITRYEEAFQSSPKMVAEPIPDPEETRVDLKTGNITCYVNGEHVMSFNTSLGVVAWLQSVLPQSSSYPNSYGSDPDVEVKVLYRDKLIFLYKDGGIVAQEPLFTVKYFDREEGWLRLEKHPFETGYDTDLIYYSSIEEPKYWALVELLKTDIAIESNFTKSGIGSNIRVFHYDYIPHDGYRPLTETELGKIASHVAYKEILFMLQRFVSEWYGTAWSSPVRAVTKQHDGYNDEGYDRQAYEILVYDQNGTKLLPVPFYTWFNENLSGQKAEEVAREDFAYRQKKEIEARQAAIERDPGTYKPFYENKPLQTYKQPFHGEATLENPEFVQWAWNKWANAFDEETKTYIASDYIDDMYNVQYALSIPEDEFDWDLALFTKDSPLMLYIRTDNP